MLFIHPGLAQNIELDTRELNDLLKKWNYANNWRSEETFRSVYYKNVILYGRNLTARKCIESRQKFLKEHPEYKQKIVSDPVFKPYVTGVIRCDFTKEAYVSGNWNKYAAYLLITYDNKRYAISGESDDQSDRLSKYKPDIGKPMEFPVSQIPPPVRDSLPLIDTVAKIAHINKEGTREDSTFLSRVSTEVLSEDPVSVPKKYIYFLVGFLTLGLLVVLFSRNGKARKPARRAVADHSPEINAGRLARNEKAFENFVVSLFDPHYFSLEVFSRESVIAGNGSHHKYFPPLQAVFQNKETSVNLVVECLYLPKATSGNLMTIFGNPIRRFKDFQEEEEGTEGYLILGFGGEPGDPKELYLVRAEDIPKGSITYGDLQPYRKYGMFFYSSAKGRLQ